MSTFQSLYGKLNQLFKCSWLTELQKNNINICIQSMQEKASFMGVADLEGDIRISNSLRPVLSSPIKGSLSLVNPRRVTRFASITASLMAQNEVSKVSGKCVKGNNTESIKQDTRVVNEAFQVN